jgi:hypothetical protein
LNASVASADLAAFFTGFDAGASSQNVAQITAMTENDADSSINN